MSKSHHYQSLAYQGECRDCGHEIDRPMPPKPEFAANSDGIHIRCGECGKTNTIQKGHDE